ncbi:MAG: B12-binding domain-containing radical SAM protein [Bauldia sp.]|nr:B12-binding domain-containing radical SAM protein [Bauldia sp.]
MSPDLLLINPGGGHAIYQSLDNEFTAIEPPLWCRLIADYVRKRGHTVQIMDAAALGLSPAQVAERVAVLSPRLVCVAAYGHQPSASTQSMEAAGAVCTAIKRRNASIFLMLVGGHVAALPERTLAEESVDFVCSGEGPATIERLLSSDHEMNAPGLLWHRGKTAPAPLLDVNDLDGDAWDLLPMEKYRAHNWQCFGNLSARQPYASIYTSLGCPYKCSFCCINAPFGTNKYRMRSPEKVVNEVRHLGEAYGVRTIKIIDEMFVLNGHHVNAICEGLSELPFADELNIWAYARIDTVKKYQLPAMRRAGIRWLALGIESGSAHVRDGANKSFNDDDIKTVVRSIQDAGINVIGNYIFGLPDDDMDSMNRTLALAKDLNCEFANFYAAMAYPGSPLYAQAVASGAELPKSWSGYSQHSRDTHPLRTATLTSADVLRFRDDAFHEYFNGAAYLGMIDRKFGTETREHVQRMAGQRLERDLLRAA